MVKPSISHFLEHNITFSVNFNFFKGMIDLNE